ncbi:DNA transport domain protein [Escherichia coli DEC13D]|nr:DNA transport domain protein [Escherichia coli DEC13C]EHX57507.1 DNA transport domain protein [Escherichia coli DEC13D]EHX76961.1 DNA transport domain protein [Escherichia coli DEC13E]
MIATGTGIAAPLGTSVGKDMGRVTLVSYSDVQTLPDLSCYVTLPGPYPAVKMALKYQQRPKVAPEFIPRTIDGKAEERLNAALAAREHESRSIAMLFEPDGRDGEIAGEKYGA